MENESDEKKLEFIKILNLKTPDSDAVELLENIAEVQNSQEEKDAIRRIQRLTINGEDDGAVQKTHFIRAVTTRSKSRIQTASDCETETNLHGGSKELQLENFTGGSTTSESSEESILKVTVPPLFQENDEITSEMTEDREKVLFRRELKEAMKPTLYNDQTKKAQVIHSKLHLSAINLHQFCGITLTSAKQIIANCKVCKNQPATNKHVRFKQTSTTPLAPMKICAADILHVSSNTKPSKALIVQDLFSKFIWLLPLYRETSRSVLNAFYQIFITTGFPSELKVDNAKYFKSQEMQNALQENGTQIIQISPYRSNAN